MKYSRSALVDFDPVASLKSGFSLTLMSRFVACSLCLYSYTSALNTTLSLNLFFFKIFKVRLKLYTVLLSLA